MFVKHAFDFDGRDVFAAGDNQILLAIYDLDVTFRVERRHIASVKPAVNDHCISRFRLPPVTGHDDVAARAITSPTCSPSGRDVLARFIHDAEIHA